MHNSLYRLYRGEWGPQMWVVLEFVGRKQEGANSETQYALSGGNR